MIDNLVLEKFINVFGKRLKGLNYSSIFYSGMLETLTNTDAFDLNIWLNHHDIQHHKFIKLKNLKVHLYVGNSDFLLRFIQNYHGIQKLSVTLHISDPFYANTLFMELSNLENLFHFSVNNFGFNDRFFDEALTRMSVNCSQLKSIDCRLNTYSNNYYKINELMSPLKQFKHLKKLKLNFVLSISDVKNLNSFNLIENTIKPLTGFEGLTQLSLKFDGYPSHIIIERIIFSFLINLTKLRF